MKRIRTGTGQPDNTCQNLGCYHAGSQGLNLRDHSPPRQKRCGRSIYPPSALAVYHPFAMLGGRSSEQWIAQYSSSHQHPVNLACHTLGIPTILLSAALFLTSIFVHKLWRYAAILFLAGWVLQFVGHAFEGKRPEFFRDWRFLLVGTRWWWAKIRGRA